VTEHRCRNCGEIVRPRLDKMTVWRCVLTPGYEHWNCETRSAIGDGPRSHVERPPVLPTPIRPGVEATDLYRYFDAAGELLYVGISFHAIVRAGAHRNSAEWWAQVHTMTVERFPTRELAAAAELVAIRTEGPRFNRAGRVPA